MAHTPPNEDVHIPSHALDALTSDALLPICVACGTQYPGARDRCVICDDPRQFVPPTGQSWTSLSDLQQSRTHEVKRDEEDHRVSFIHTTPGFGINQTPILLETANGSYIWDCSAALTLHLISHLLSLSKPLKAIAISHPHFFSTALTWSRALQVPLYLCEADKAWFQRLDDVRDTDQIRWWSNETELGPGVKLIQCGGHFPGSSVLHWDRLSEPPPPPDNLPRTPTPVSGLLLTSDTIMVMPTQSLFTFIWSAPNMIPLRPKQALAVVRRLETVPFSQATSTWPGRFIRQDAKKILQESVEKHIGACGWKLEDDRYVPRE
ncbi:hypothetical protein DB88DRAFT_507865 [Papiliotrema laurentii]|uniref:Metallo-beta-lactamase domain-containing protein n=1 Tax=Papiliotrema laurentii TaxID=5418 RepID=A0AAD9FXF3_PAPLA|nr:hypothetical protein DB88DRAFT_507865 [Papiliotrema laurentii]